MKRSVFIMAFAGTAALGLAALAQQTTTISAAPKPVDPAIAEKLRATLKEKALMRPLRNPPPIGAKAREIVDGKIDWIAMKTQLAISARRDNAAASNMTAAVPRPPGLRASAPERFKNVRTLEVNRARLPVLAPAGSRIAETLKIYTIGDSFAAVAEVENGVSMRLSGTRKKIVIGDPKTAQRRLAYLRKARKSMPSLDTEYVVTRSDSSTDLSFAKFGAGYVLSIMCDDPDDARCAKDDFIAKLASNFVLLNPEAGGE